MMTVTGVHEVVSRLKAAGVPFWLDGGWGIDALVGRETRPHDDLDLVVSRDTLGDARLALAPLGFEHAPEAAPGLPARLVVRDPGGRQVDFHVVVFDQEGNGHQELDDGCWGLYPREGLVAFGSVAGRRIPCVTAEVQVRHHFGYELDERDHADIRVLATVFRLELPPDFG
jgi:lincosamide nucleotidyltransferase A/C/D/E